MYKLGPITGVLRIENPIRKYKTIHIIPLNDLYNHVESMVCSCYPKVQYNRNGRVITHNAHDVREFYEKATGQSTRGKEWISIINHVPIELGVWVNDARDYAHKLN